MATMKRVGALILFFALSYYYVDAKRKIMPITGLDFNMGENVAKDELAPGEKIVNVMSFGAKPDGEFDCTLAFMNAWRQTCQSKVQARLLIPQGRFVVSSMFFAGPCMSPGPVTIQVVGTVVATTDISEYVNGEWLFFQDLEGIKLIGGGTFDGKGKDSWENSENCETNPSEYCIRNPSSLYFRRVSNGLIENIKSVDPKGYHIFLTNCDNMRLRLLNISAPADSLNTDGIHVSQSVNVILSENNIETGNDCVSMVNGVRNIDINKIKCGPGYGISIGSLGKYPDELEVKDILVTNCTMVGTTNGVRIKTWPDRYPGTASDITFSNIVMEEVKNPIIIDQEYQCDPHCKKPSLVEIADVKYSNIRGTTVSPIAVDLRCSKQYPCKDIELRNIDLKFGAKPTGSRCANTNPVYVGLQRPQPCL